VLRLPPAEPVQLAAGPIRWGRPLPGKDGKSIFAEGQVSRGELSRFDAHTKQFQPFLGGISAQGAVFSNDGRSVAYVSFPESILWKANRDGSNAVQLSDSSMWAVLPRWSPDGKQIAFTGQTKTSHGQRTFVVSAAGDSPPKLLVELNEQTTFPYWAPDGHKIVFTAWSARDTPDIRILDLDTRQITTIAGSEGLFAPRWSPDGRYLCSSHDELNLKIFDFKTQQWSELQPNGSVDSWEWSRDGRYIYFRRVMGDLGVFRISVKSGKVEKIVDLKDWHDAGWFAKYMGLDPTDAPLLLRDIGSDDIYSLTLDQE
jgi:WD40 repeat protein